MYNRCTESHYPPPLWGLVRPLSSAALTTPPLVAPSFPHLVLSPCPTIVNECISIVYLAFTTLHTLSTTFSNRTTKLSSRVLISPFFFCFFPSVRDCWLFAFFHRFFACNERNYTSKVKCYVLFSMTACTMLECFKKEDSMLFKRQATRKSWSNDYEY